MGEGKTAIENIIRTTDKIWVIKINVSMSIKIHIKLYVHYISIDI